MATVSHSSPHAGKRELRCGVCGYGVIVEQPLPACPICRSTAWRPLPVRRAPARAI